MKQILNRQEIEDVLRKYIRTKEGALLDCRISGFEPFKELYGPAASDEVLHFTERLIEDVLTEVGTPNDRLGEPEVNNFVIITTATAMPRIRERLQSRFNNEVLAFYSLHDRER